MFKRLCSLLLALCLIFTILPAQNVEAKASIDAPKTLKVQDGVYYAWILAHEDELDFVPGDNSSAKISWSKVSGAAGYKVKIVWDAYGKVYTDTINVTKQGKNYIMKTSDKLYKTPKQLVYGIGSSTIKTSKLSFCVSGYGSDFALKKVTVKSYKKVNGKKIWSKSKTKLFN